MKRSNIVLKAAKTLITNEKIDNSTFGAVKNITTNLFKKWNGEQNDNIKMKWGRWNLDYCDVKQEIKSNNANRDHCGDIICGNPSMLKETYGK